MNKHIKQSVVLFVASALSVLIYDPWTNPAIAEHEYGLTVTNELPIDKFDAAEMTVVHNEFRELDVTLLVKENSVIYDVKGVLPREIVDGRL